MPVPAEGHDRNAKDSTTSPPATTGFLPGLDLVATTLAGWTIERMAFVSKGETAIRMVYSVPLYLPDGRLCGHKLRGATEHHPDGAKTRRISIRWDGDGIKTKPDAHPAILSPRLRERLFGEGEPLNVEDTVLIVCGETDFLAALGTKTAPTDLILSGSMGEGTSLAEWAPLVRDAGRVVVVGDHDGPGIENGYLRAQEFTLRYSGRKGELYLPPDPGSDLCDLIARDHGDLTNLITDPARRYRPPHALITLADVLLEPDPPPVEEIVQGVLARGGIHVLFGPSGSCKSWSALHLAFAAAQGRGLFMGIEDAPILLPMSPHRVLWVYGSEDSPRRVFSRARLVAHHYEHLDTASVAFINAAQHPADTPEGWENLLARAREHNATFVVIDTVSSATTLDPSDGNSVKSFLNTLHTEIQDPDSPIQDILLVHHTRKVSQQARKTGVSPYNADSMLGAGEWRNLADSIIMISADDGKVAQEDDGGIDVLVIKGKDLETKLPPSRVLWNRDDQSFQQTETKRDQKRSDENLTESSILCALHLLTLDSPGTSVGASDLTQKATALGASDRRATRAAALTRLTEQGLISSEGQSRWKNYALTTKGLAQAQQIFADCDNIPE